MEAAPAPSVGRLARHRRQPWSELDEYDRTSLAGDCVRRRLNQAVFEKFFIDEDGTVTGELAEPFNILLNPHLLVETKDDPEDRYKATEGAQIPSDEAIDPMHRDENWRDGIPAWLADGRWSPRTCQTTNRRRPGRPRHTTATTPVLHGLGSKQSYLAVSV